MHILSWAQHEQNTPSIHRVRYSSGFAATCAQRLQQQAPAQISNSESSNNPQNAAPSRLAAIRFTLAWRRHRGEECSVSSPSYGALQLDAELTGKCRFHLHQVRLDRFVIRELVRVTGCIRCLCWWCGEEGEHPVTYFSPGADSLATSKTKI